MKLSCEICLIYIIQIYSGITCGRVLNGELYTCKLHKLINVCWSTGCFVKLHFTPRYLCLIYMYNCIHEKTIKSSCILYGKKNLQCKQISTKHCGL